MTATLIDAYRTADVARALGVAQNTIWRFACSWYPRRGSGSRLRFTRVDLMVCRAWVVINKRRSIGYDHDTRWLLQAAETAIRSEPRRWLLIGHGQALTFAEAEAAGEAWLRWPRPRSGAWLIDLLPWEEAAAA